MDPRTSECKAAYEEWAAKEMPWVLEKPEDDMEKLVRTTRDDRSAIAQVVAVHPLGLDGHGVNWLHGAMPKPGDLLYTRSSDAEFKNFHRALCERFCYTHDEVDWRRDQVSLIEHIAKRFSV